MSQPLIPTRPSDGPQGSHSSSAFVSLCFSSLLPHNKQPQNQVAEDSHFIGSQFGGSGIVARWLQGESAQVSHGAAFIGGHASLLYWAPGSRRSLFLSPCASRHVTSLDILVSGMNPKSECGPSQWQRWKLKMDSDANSRINPLSLPLTSIGQNKRQGPLRPKVRRNSPHVSQHQVGWEILS